MQQKLTKERAVDFLKGLTHRPGVYQMLDNAGTVIYVGKARDLKKRLSSYFSAREKDIKTTRLLEHVVDITVTVTHSENAALLLECNLIKRLRPHYNVLFRDDKSYPYILLTAHRFPRITLYRGRQKKPAGHLYGPFVESSSVRETIHLSEKIFRIRNCSDSFFSSRRRPCIQYQIGRCTAPCVGLVSEEAYCQQVRDTGLFLEGKNNEVMQQLQTDMVDASEQRDYEKAAVLRDRIALLRDIHSRQVVNFGEANADVLGFAENAGTVCIQILVIRNGRMLGSRAFFSDLAVMSSPIEIITAFIVQRYLDAGFPSTDVPALIVTGIRLTESEGLKQVLHDKAGHVVTLSAGLSGIRKKWVGMAESSAHESIAARVLTKTSLQARFKALAECLDLPVTPSCIECVDISHTMGEATVGSCVSMGPEGPLKHFYRCFNITGVTGGDDVGAMKQLLQRRYAGLSGADDARIPDLLLVDGGIPQIRVVTQTLLEMGLSSIPVVGVAKGVTRKPGFETLYLPGEKPCHLSPDSPALHLIQQVRDEAHRFAISGHRARRDRKRTQSVLETIPGIGAGRRRALLRHFGGLQAISRASLDDLMQVQGISRMLAEQIYEVLHG